MLPGGWFWPLHDRLDLAWICLHLPATKYVTQKTHVTGVELLRLDVQPVLQKLLQDLTHMGYML